MSDRLRIVADRHGYNDIDAMLAEWATLTPTEIQSKFGVSRTTISLRGVFKRTNKEKVYAPETVASIKHDLECGLLVKDIASKLGISRQWVHEIMDRNGFSSRSIKGKKNG